MAANTAEVKKTALSLDAAFSDERQASMRPGRIAPGRQERLFAVRRDHTRIVAAALIVSAIGCLILEPQASCSCNGYRESEVPEQKQYAWSDCPKPDTPQPDLVERGSRPVFADLASTH